MAIEILRFEDHLGFYDLKTNKRLSNLQPNKKIMIKVKATAFEGGYRYLEIGDLHKELRNKKTITLAQYKQLTKRYKIIK